VRPRRRQTRQPAVLTGGTPSFGESSAEIVSCVRVKTVREGEAAALQSRILRSHRVTWSPCSGKGHHGLKPASACLPSTTHFLKMDNRRSSLQNGRQERKRASSPYARPASPATRAPAGTPVSPSQLAFAYALLTLYTPTVSAWRYALVFFTLSLDQEGQAAEPRARAGGAR